MNTCSMDPLTCRVMDQLLAEGKYGMDGEMDLIGQQHEDKQPAVQGAQMDTDGKGNIRGPL